MVEESKKDPVYAAYAPCIITKESILTASPSQLEVLLQHIILVKGPVVHKKFKLMFIPSLLSIPSISMLKL